MSAKYVTFYLMLDDVRMSEFYSLVGDNLEHQVIQKSELLCNLQGRVGLEGLCFPSLCLGKAHTPALIQTMKLYK